MDSGAKAWAKVTRILMFNNEIIYLWINLF